MYTSQWNVQVNVEGTIKTVYLENYFRVFFLYKVKNPGKWWIIHKRECAKLSPYLYYMSVQFSSVAQLCLTLCDPMNYSMSGFPVLHQLLELAQTHVH